MGLNHPAPHIIYNDNLNPLVEIFKYLQTHNKQEILDYINKTIQENNLNKTDKNAYILFRNKYNNSFIKHPLDLYVLINFSFNYQIRFNNKGEFNNPHGTNRSSFNKNMKNRLIQCIDILHQKDITFLNKDFTQLDFKQLDSESLVYCDPPYLITDSTYNKNWTLKEEHLLYRLLNKLDTAGVKFVLSNVLTHDGKVNTILKRWLSKNNYNLKNISSNYTNSNYHKKNTNNIINREVLVFNY